MPFGIIHDSPHNACTGSLFKNLVISTMPVLWIRIYFLMDLDPDSDSDLTLISDPDSDTGFMKNTFELQICRSSKHSKKADFLKPVHFWIRIIDEKYK
jgi:hypothetical protein